MVRSFFHPLERSKPDGGNVARMVRNIEASSAIPAQQREAVVEPGSVLSSSKLPMPPKVPTTKAGEKMEQFFSSLLVKVSVCSQKQLTHRSRYHGLLGICGHHCGLV